jgi:hypothetical protein
MTARMMPMDEPEERKHINQGEIQQVHSEAQEARVRQEYEELLGKVQSVVHTSFERDLSSFDSIQLGNVHVDVKEFQSDFISFSLQQQLFEREGIGTPVVEVRAKYNDMWIPIDFGFRGFARDVDEIYQSDQVFNAVANKYRHGIQLANTSGLSVGSMDKDQAKLSFFSGIASSIITRFFSSNQAPDDGGPPPAVVSVTTDAERQLVLYCKGYFFSTEQAFAYSNPACRAIDRGWYMFGLHTARGPRFMDVLFEVPPHTEVRLELP